MKLISTFVPLAAALILAVPTPGVAEDKKAPKQPEAKADSKAKPYTLDTCIVADEKLGSMGKAYVFVHEGQELKLCCKGCLKDFNKEPAKYMKKLTEAEKKKSKKS